MTRNTEKCRGSALLEALLVLPLLGVALALNLELLRKTARESALHWVTFAWTRERALGASRSQVGRRAHLFWARALSGAAEPRVDETRTVGGLTVRAHDRYPSLMRVRFSGGWKRSYEVNTQCRYYFSP